MTKEDKIIYPSKNTFILFRRCYICVQLQKAQKQNSKFRIFGRFTIVFVLFNLGFWNFSLPLKIEKIKMEGSYFKLFSRGNRNGLPMTLLHQLCRGLVLWMENTKSFRKQIDSLIPRDCKNNIKKQCFWDQIIFGCFNSVPDSQQGNLKHCLF